MKYKVTEIFPTKILLVNVSDEITHEDKNLLVESVDDLYQKGCWDKDEEKPKYQTYTFLFNEKTPDIWTNSKPYLWAKLKKTFINSCYLYLETIDDFISEKKNCNIHSVRAWCYKSNSDNVAENYNPMHSHFPSFLSGIFYLKMPQDVNHVIGTEFENTNNFSIRNTIVLNDEFCWTIFPGHLKHRACQINSNEYRYVIAADCYVSRY